MKTTDRGLLALVRHEGIVPGPYFDSTNTWTFGIGHTAAAGPPDPARMPRGSPADIDERLRAAFRLFRADLLAFEAEVLRAIKVLLAPHEFDALVSFHYNTGGIARAALTRHLNEGDRAAAAEAFLTGGGPRRSSRAAKPNAISSAMGATRVGQSRSGQSTRLAEWTFRARSGG